MFKHISAALAASAMIAGSAQAGQISFADFAAGNEGGVENGTIIDFDGVNILFLANNGVPYFDDEFNNRPAGVGVCGAVVDSGALVGGSIDTSADITSDGSHCAQSGDDSIDADEGLEEFLALLFVNDAGDDNVPIDILDIAFRDGQHHILDGDNTLLFDAVLDGGLAANLFNGGSLEFTFQQVIALANSGQLSGVSLLFFGYGGDNPIDFYIESISDIPIPGALPLLLSGLAGLGFASQRKKKTA